MTDKTIYPFGIFVSSEDKLGTGLDFSLLKNVKFMIANAGHLQYHDSSLEESQDPMFATWVQKAYDYDMPVGALLRVNPSYYPQAFGSNVDGATINSDKQILLLRECLRSGAVEAKKFKRVHFIVLDCSRYWEFQNEYDDYLAKKISRSKIKVVSASWILKSIRHLLSNIALCKAQGLLPDIPVVLRTGKWFIEGFTRADDGGSLYDTTPSYPIVTCTPPVSSPEISSFVNPADIQAYYPGNDVNPDWLNGQSFVWEFRSDNIQNGNNAIEVGFLLVWKSLDNLYTWSNFTPRIVTPDIPTPEENPVEESEATLGERVTRIERILNDIHTALHQ